MLVPSGSLNVQGNLTVSTSNVVTIKQDLLVTGTCEVAGALKVETGGLEVKKTLAVTGTVMQQSAVLAEPSVIEKVMLTKGTVTFYSDVELGEVVVEKDTLLTIKSNLTVVANCDVSGSLVMDTASTTLHVGKTLAVLQYGKLTTKGDIVARYVVTRG